MILFIIPVLLIPVYNLLIKKKKYVVILSFIGLLIPMLLRSIDTGVDIGTHSYGYLGGYEYVSRFSFSELVSRLHLIKVADLKYPYSFESGYTVINWIFGRLGFSFHGFLVVSSMFFMFSTAKFILKYSNCYWLSCYVFSCMFVYQRMFCLLRQTYAICILLFAVSAIEKKELKKFLMLVFLAFTVHRISIVFLPAYFLYRKPIGKYISFYKKPVRKKEIKRLYYLIMAFFVTSPVWSAMLIRIILISFGKMSYSSGGGGFSLNILFLVMMMLLTAVVFFVRTDTINQKNINFGLWSLIIVLPIEIIGLYQEIIARSVDIYWIHMCVFVPNLISSCRDKSLKMMFKVCLPMILFLYYVRNLLGGSMQLFPFEITDFKEFIFTK